MTKECLQCRRALPLTQYHVDATGRYGVKARCKRCRNTKRAHERALVLDAHLRMVGPSGAVVASPGKSLEQWEARDAWPSAAKEAG